LRIERRTAQGTLFHTSVSPTASPETLEALDAVADAALAHAIERGLIPRPPRRVRVEGDLYHGRVPEGAVYVGRAAPGLPASPYANPYTVKEHGETAVQLFVAYLDRRPELVERARRELAGKDLACWCKLDRPCHVDEWLRRLAG